MNLLALAPDWLLGLLVVVLAAAAVQDALQLRIHNGFSGAVALGALVAAALAGPQWALWQNLLLFALALVIGTFLFSAGLFGGGDVKLLAAMLLWLDLLAAGQLLVAAAIAGGLWTLVVQLLRRRQWSDRAVRRFPLLQRQGGIAYAVALAIGMIVIMPHGGGVGWTPWEFDRPH